MASGSLHRHLARQLRKLGLDATESPTPGSWASFLASVGQTYEDMDLERYTLERSVGLFEREMRDLNTTLEHERDRMQLLFDLAPVGITCVELDGSIRMANQALQQMLGYTEDELITKQVKDLVCSEDQSAIAGVFGSWNGTQAKGARATLHRFLHKNGAIVYTQMNASTAVDSDGKPLYVILILSDVSERLRLELELRQAQKLESVGRLAAGIAHEVNTPIQFIGDNTKFVRSALTDLLTLCDCYRDVLEGLRDQVSREQAAAIRVAEENADLEYLKANVGPSLASTLDGVDRVSVIVKAMKSFAHPDRMEKAPTDLTAALQNTLIVAANELKYVATVEKDFCSLPLVNCYESALNQVFLNLLINAAHAIADVVGSSGERGTIRIRTYVEDTDIVIAIGDTGTGIPVHVREHIFDPFFTTKEVGRGSGQGLAISRAVVERHGGTLTFETELGKGTTFYIRFPHGLPAAESKAS